MYGDHFAHPTGILPLQNAVVLAQQHFWDSFPPQLLDHQITIATTLEDLTSSNSDQNLAIVVLDDSDIQNQVVNAWGNESVREIIIVLPEPSSHYVRLRNLSRLAELSNQLESFVQRDNILTLKFVKDIPTEWDLPKLLEAIEVISQSESVQASQELSPKLRDELVSLLTTFEHLVDLIGLDHSSLLGLESSELDVLRGENTRLKSNNASLRIQVEALHRKYNALANSRLGKLILKRWERK